MTTLDNVVALESRHILGTYKRQPVVFVRGDCARLYDADGREYLDLVSGIGVASLGHANPRPLKSIPQFLSDLALSHVGFLLKMLDPPRTR